MSDEAEKIKERNPPVSRELDGLLAVHEAALSSLGASRGAPTHACTYCQGLWDRLSHAFEVRRILSCGRLFWWSWCCSSSMLRCPPFLGTLLASIPMIKVNAPCPSFFARYKVRFELARRCHSDLLSARAMALDFFPGSAFPVFPHSWPPCACCVHVCHARPNWLLTALFRLRAHSRRSLSSIARFASVGPGRVSCARGVCVPLLISGLFDVGARLHAVCSRGMCIAWDWGGWRARDRPSWAVWAWDCARLRRDSSLQIVKMRN